MKIRTSILFVVMCLLISACSNVEREQGVNVDCTYTSLLKMQETDEYVSAEIVNPWDTTKILHKYILVDKNEPTPDNLPEGTVVKVPLEKSVVYSSVHMALLNEWNKLDAVTGVCDLQYIMVPEVQKLAKEGKIKDLGSTMQPEVERIIETSPDAILVSPYENNNGYGKLEKSGIPIIECADYMEVSPLARAEWMKFYGLLYGCREKAFDEFENIAKEYNGLKDSIAADTAARPTVFADMKLGNQWMVPGGKSTVGIFLHDAGADYLFADLPQSGSVTVSNETVLDKCQKADFWLIKYNSIYNGYVIDYDKLASLDPMYKEFEPVKAKKVFCCDTSVTGFYEETPFHPERLLENLVSIFRGSENDSHNKIYYKKID